MLKKFRNITLTLCTLIFIFSMKDSAAENQKIPVSVGDQTINGYLIEDKTMRVSTWR
jgi:hypothetical protein